MNEQELVDLLAGTRIDWEATPQSVMGPQHEQVITSQEDIDQMQQRDREMVGYGYFYVDCRNMDANLALMHCTKPGFWVGEQIPQELSPLLPEDLRRSIEEAGGAINWSGHYPLDAFSLEKLQLSYLGN